MPPAPVPRTLITGIGMVSALGRDAVTSCASARAGLSRLGPMDGPMLVDPESGELDRPYGHTVAGVSDGFWKLGRLLRLGTTALLDLLPADSERPRARTGLFLNLPSGFYTREAERRVRETQVDDEEQEPNQPFEADLRRDFYAERLSPALCDAVGLKIPSEARHVYFGDAAGFASALADAIAALGQGVYDQCIVGGIDALVEEDLLEALDYLGLLKTNARPDGFLPGEGAAFLRLEREGAARPAGKEPVVEISSVAIANEPFHRLSGDRAVGRALADVMAGALGAQVNLPGLAIGNVNGDPYRSYDWGCAIVRLRATHPEFDAPTWHPVASFGELGAAAGPVAACMAARALAGDYAGTGRVLAWLVGDDGGRGAFTLQRLAA
jgi:3-oxoacyl-[acyl-carrier-protein] synthase I